MGGGNVFTQTTFFLPTRRNKNLNYYICHY